MPTDERAPATEALTVLAGGELVPAGRLPWSSNATFLVNVEHEDGTTMPAVYKPVRGEQPLWDFPGELAAREVAAYHLSAALGWGIVPETIMRSGGPFGRGSLQRFVPAHFEQHYFTLLDDPAHHDALRTIATFDLLANNADRKSGHCLLGEDGRIWAIDNGLCFHEGPKLRTVIWDFAGQRVPEALLADVERVATVGVARLSGLIFPDEEVALARRAAAVLRLPVFPDPGPSRRAYPWPLV